MADERILTAPTVEQNVNITISGEEKLHDFASTLNDLAENKALNKYWKTQEELIKDVTNACEIYSKNIDNKKNATELLKFANALKAVSGTDLSTLFPNFKDISHYIEQATLKIGSLDKAFSVQNLQKVFESFKIMQAYGLDLDRMFKHFEIKPDVTELENSFKESQNQVTRLTEKIERLRDRLESAESGSGIDVLRQKCEELEYQLDEIHENAQKTFQSFLQLNNLDSYGFNDLTESYVENVKNGYLTAEQAIANFKREYAYLFDDANFDTTQLKDFASTLNQVSNTVSAVSDKLENLEFGPGSGSNANNQAINQVSTDIDSLLSLLNGIDFQGKSGNIQEMYVALANVLTILKEIAQTDQDSLYSIFGIIQNLAKLDDLKINKTSLDNLANCLERIAGIENGNAFNNLSNVDLSKFNDLHITKASLSNLAEYLPSIANINVEILERLSKIDFNNFNELQTNKATLENLKSFASMLREAFNGTPDEEGNGLEEIGKSATDASKAKNSFSDANKNVQKSIDESIPKLQVEADLFKGIADNAKAAANAKEKFAKANVNNGTNNSGKSNSPQSKKTSVKKNQNIDLEIENKLAKIDSFIKTSESYLKQSLNRPGPQDQSELYKEHLVELKTNLNDLKQLKEKVSKQDIVSEEDMGQLNFFQAKVDGLIRSLKAMYASEKGSDSLQRSKLKDTIEQYMNLNSNISKHFKNELKRLINELDFGGPNVNVKALRDEFLALKSAIRGAGQEGKAFLDVVKDKAWYGLAATLGTYFGLDDVINLVQEGARQVINLNSKIVDLAKVSEQTTKQIYENFSDYSTIAKDIGATISDTIDATANWSRNGYNIPDAQDLAEVALIYKNVGDNIDISAANDSLISTLRGFKMEANEAMKIVDVFNEVSNNEAITSSGIGEALQRSAASFEVAGTSLEKAVALVTATNSVIQNPDKVGNMWKVVSARIRGAKTELLEMGEETEGMVESTSKLRALVKGITGFDIMEDENTFKDIYEIVLGIGKAWDDVNDIDRAALLETLAGKQQSNSLAAALSNTDILEKSYKEAMQSAGSAMREQEKYQESIQYSIDRAKASLEELSNTTINSESLKDFIDFGNGVIQVLNQIIEKFGLMPGVVATATAFLGRGKLEQQFCPVWG